jgi:AbiV family abortive infection protein
MSFSLKQIDDYILALTTNAESLIHEASILFKHQAFARAFALSHLAREELSKCLMLQAAGIKLLAGHPVDYKKLLKRLRDHKAKLAAEHVQNSVMVTAVGGLEQGREMLEVAMSLTTHRNNRKNASLYVGFENETVTQPSDQFTEHQAARNISLAADALAQRKKMLDLMGHFSERDPIEMIRIEPGDINRENLESLLENMAESMAFFFKEPDDASNQ